MKRIFMNEDEVPLFGEKKWKFKSQVPGNLIILNNNEWIKCNILESRLTARKSNLTLSYF